MPTIGALSELVTLREAVDKLSSHLAQQGPWFDKRALAAHYSCSVRTVEEWMAEGIPHAIIAGRVKFKVAECERWLERHERIQLRGDRQGGTVVVGSESGAASADNGHRPRHEERGPHAS